MNKKGLNFKLGIFAIFIVSATVIALGVMVRSWNETYDSGLNYDLGNLNEMNEMSSQVQAQQGNVTIESSFDQGLTNFEGTSLRGVFGIINKIFAPFRVVFGDGGMVDVVIGRFGIPDYIRQLVIVLMIVAITFALVALFFRKPGGDA